jgi:uncharacterized SAM-binding protein YcdF (DUF218 family)
MESPTSFFSLNFGPRKRLGWKGRSLVLLGLLLTLYLAGFGLFLATLPKPFTTLPPEIEGLVAFTGGAGRVQTLLHQMDSGFTGPILISGTRGNTSLHTILTHAGEEKNLSDSQKNHILQDASQTTRENVESLKVWAAYLEIHNIGIITSTYHAPRVRFLAWWVAPELNITVLPVQPADAGIHPLFKEYNKLLLLPLMR